MTTPPRPEVIRTAQDLTDALLGVSSRLDQVKTDSEERDEELRQYGRRNRFLIWVAALGLALDVTASAVAIYALVQEHHATAAAAHNAATVAQLHANNVTACQSGNARLAKQRAALDRILTAVPPTSAAAQAYIANAEAAVSDGWATRACEQIYSLNK